MHPFTPSTADTLRMTPFRTNRHAIGSHIQLRVGYDARRLRLRAAEQSNWTKKRCLFKDNPSGPVSRSKPSVPSISPRCVWTSNRERGREIPLLSAPDRKCVGSRTLTASFIDAIRSDVASSYSNRPDVREPIDLFTMLHLCPMSPLRHSFPMSRII